MEFPAASAHRGLVPWLALLLAAFWIPPTTGRFGIVTTSVAEGQDVILRTIDTPPEVSGYLWYRGLEIKFSNLIGVIAWHLSGQVKGPKYTGREIAKLDGSLTIRKVTPRDQGNYIAVAVLPKSRVTGFGRLNVYRPVSVPTLLASSTTVTENEDAVVMTCYTDVSSTDWLFNATCLRLRESMKLSEDHRTLTIDPVRREDAGNYQCSLQPRQFR
ncbi:carcinoembryonic antigen-related cell adhesion molecule 21-like [Eptesicus fuscus]|uniref:carcinoembryonic antigen-related cell adhesion molecule 21-like n=1 Tax=Eptesicus fuscus TaxID=29078 RepID=UPI002404344D|nr:carcinoembryonic antigen-related cell adhesion molecule 21-like [Eptesicus fuscus]